MIDFGQVVKNAEPIIKQTGKFIKTNGHYFVEGGLASGLLLSIGYNIMSENEHEERDKLVENQLRRDHAIIKDLSTKAQKVDELEKCNELLMDALTKNTPNTVEA